MERLVGHIERVLLQHDCVIVPGFGGFVLQSVPAVYRSDEHSFTPALKEVVFNPTLTHNDGLLVESYMQVYAIDFNVAQQFVAADVAEMKALLEEKAEVEIGQVGLFMKEDNHTLFVPSKNCGSFFCMSSYGLPVFHYLPLSTLMPADEPRPVFHSVEPTNDKETSIEKRDKSSSILYQIPITRTFVQVLAASVAVVLLFLLISPSVTNVDQANYPASFIPPDIMRHKTADEIVADAFAESGTIASQKVDTKERQEIPATNQEIPVMRDEIAVTTNVTPAVSPNKTASAKASPTVARSTDATPSYYIIIASYYKREDALKHIKGLKGADATNAKILVADGRVRVYYAQAFSTENAARASMSQLLQTSKQISDAWIYKSKK